MRALLMLALLTACGPRATFAPPEPLGQPAWSSRAPSVDPERLQAIFPLASGDRWSWDVVRVDRRKGRFLLFIPMDRTSRDTVGTWTLTVGAPDPASGRFPAELVRAEEDVDERTTVSLWHTDAGLWMDDGTRSGPALVVHPPDDAVRGEILPCDVPLLGVQATCHAIPGGHAAHPPGPMRADLSTYRHGGSGDVAAMLLTGFVLMPMGRTTDHVLDLADHPDVSSAGPELPLTEAVRTHRTGFLRVSKAAALQRWLARPDRPELTLEDAVGALRHAPTASVVESLVEVLGPQARLPLTRVLLRRTREDEDRLGQLVAALDRLSDLDGEDRLHLVLCMEAPWARRQATRILAGNTEIAQVYAGTRTWLDVGRTTTDPVTRRAIVDAYEDDSMRRQIVWEMIQASEGAERLDLVRYALWFRPEDRLALLLSGEPWIAELPNALKDEIPSLFEGSERRRVKRALKGR